jgi:voltage-gated potassium channel
MKPMGQTERPGRQVVTSRHSVTYNIFILLLTLFALVVMVGLVAGAGEPVAGVLLSVDHVICIVLFADFGLNLFRAPSRRAYFFRHGGWLDLIGTVPAVPGLPWTALFRLARLASLWRVARNLRDRDRYELITETRRRPARAALLTMTIAACVLLTAVSLLVLLVERGAPGASILTGEDAFWWSVVTVTTVGYGDYVPVTVLGRLLALVLMVFGIGIFGVLTSLMARRIARMEDDDTDALQAVLDENARIRSELAGIRALMEQESQDLPGNPETDAALPLED